MIEENVVADATRLPAQVWARAPVAPWSRWAARTIDALLLGFFGGILIELVLMFGFDTSLDTVLPLALAQGVLVLVLAAIGCALMYGLTATTPGKFLFGIRVEGTNGGPPGLRRALLREVDVLVRGLGLGVPLIAMITQLVAYRTLEREGQSSWDGDWRGTVVLYRAAGTTRTLLAVLGIAALVVGYAAIIMLYRLD